MTKMFIHCFVVLFFLAAICYGANTGKIVGDVKDTGTGEALPGVNVLVNETTLGAVTDLNGHFVILKVPPGSYSLTASMIGYTTMQQTRVQVNAARTTQINFNMESTVIDAGETVTIVAERPPVPPDRTSSEVFVEAEVVQVLPVRSVEEVLQLQPGVFGEHIRGGENNDAAFYFDGVKTKDGLNDANYAKFNIYAIQELQLITGGFNAEYGNIQSGVINVTMKEGSSQRYSGMIGYRWKPAGIYHWGPHLFSTENHEWQFADIEHPIWDESYPDNPSTEENEQQIAFDRFMKMIQPPARFQDYDKYNSHRFDVTLSGPIPLLNGSSFFLAGRMDRPAPTFPTGRESNIDDNYNLTITYPLSKNMEISLGGMYGTDTYNSMATQNGKPSRKFCLYGDEIINYYNSSSLKFSHVLGPKSFYDVRLSVYTREQDDRVISYPEYMFDEYQPFRDYRAPAPDRSNELNADHSLAKTYNLKADIVSQLNASNEMKAGIDISYYDLHQSTHSTTVQGNVIRSESKQEWREYPVDAGFYIQDKLEFEGLILNGGIRVDLYNPMGDYYTNLFDPLGLYSDDDTTSASASTKSEWKVSVGPRLGISHPITETAVLHFQYGYFFQRKSWLNLLRQDFSRSGTEVLLLSRYGNRDLDYQKTAAYEVGIRKSFQDKVRLGLTGYYKDIREQAQSTNYVNLKNISYTYDQNRGYADARGFEITLDTVQPLFGIFSFMLNYEYAIVRGGSWGFSRIYEQEGIPSEPSNPSQTLRGHVRDNKARAALYMMTPRAWGPKLMDVFPFSNLYVGLFYIYTGGEYFTYHREGDPSRAENNMKWDPSIDSRLKVQKRFKVWGLEPEFFFEIHNLLGRKELDLGHPRVSQEANLEAYLFQGVAGEDLLGVDDTPINQWPWATNKREFYWGLNIYF